MAGVLSRYRKVLESRRASGTVINCALCREPITDFISLDHIMPKSRGGQDVRANLQPTHSKCNWAKGDSLPIFEEGRIDNVKDGVYPI